MEATEYIFSIGDIIVYADNKQEAKEQAEEMIMQGDYEINFVEDL